MHMVAHSGLAMPHCMQPTRPCAGVSGETHLSLAFLTLSIIVSSLNHRTVQCISKLSCITLHSGPCQTSYLEQ